MKNQEAKLFDLIIIGGGPAGASAALVAGRCRLEAVILNAERPRNLVTTASHGFLTRDGAHPSELMAIAKEQLSKYPTVRYINAAVTSVDKHGGVFSAEYGDGERVRAARIILATGFRDVLASVNLPGLEEVYGKSVYPCPFCDGFEHGDERLAVFGAEGVENYAPLLKMWTDDLAVFTNGRALEAGVPAALTRNGVAVYEAPVRRLVSSAGLLRAVELEDGTSVERDAGFLWDEAGTPANDFAERLGVEKKASAWGGLGWNADENGKTNAEGVYLVGDARTGFSGLMFAASEGGGCVEHIVHELSRERWVSDEEAV